MLTNIRSYLMTDLCFMICLSYKRDVPQFRVGSWTVTPCGVQISFVFELFVTFR